MAFHERNGRMIYFSGGIKGLGVLSTRFPQLQPKIHSNFLFWVKSSMTCTSLKALSLTTSLMLHQFIIDIRVTSNCAISCCWNQFQHQLLTWVVGQAWDSFKIGKTGLIYTTSFLRVMNIRFFCLWDFMVYNSVLNLCIEFWHVTHCVIHSWDSHSLRIFIIHVCAATHEFFQRFDSRSNIWLLFKFLLQTSTMHRKRILQRGPNRV